ncbi:alcohol oxidase [Delitschia confertaspora ATCC 74209]|uniref:Alcohol oxidase n=1 Tax=Delitschia confertaspora ATCC 74209 TaxID=1513339 RepID=A0A9P4JE73_9PLEO|nr:alcohol oxidase [Delitschia confertaspora ATCC 74209]
MPRIHFDTHSYTWIIEPDCKNEMSSPIVDEGVYDYIICGGGTSGCVLAGCLAEDPSLRILVLEAGPDNADLENVHMAGGWSALLDHPETDWNILTTPQPGLNDRQVKCSRGRFLGGSSGLNGTLCIPGTKQDYDDWGLEGWGGEDMFGWMRKAESFHPKPQFQTSASAHGTSGALHTEPHDLAPISELVKKSFISKGLEYYPDMFSRGDVPHGCSDVMRTVHQGVRSTAADFITKGYHRERITIKTGVIVDRAVLEKDSESGELVAIGAVTVSKDGEAREYRARKEVIVSGGAYCSPGILMRSGIGGKEELEKLGIECQIDLPGVGKNLQDHVLCFLFYDVLTPNLTNDHLVYPVGAAESTYALYKEKKTGVLSTFPFGVFAYARLGSRLQDSKLWTSAPHAPGRDPMGLTPSQPNIEFANTELYGGPKQFNEFPTEGKSAFAMCVVLMNQQSRGSVRLKSRDPRSMPVVDHAYLKEELDAEVLAEGCRFADEIVREGEGTRDVVGGVWGEDKARGGGFGDLKTREEWKAWVRENATTCYHAGGTCAMGPPDSPSAVLDARLRVRGVRNLRVADVSVVPSINNGHTQMVAYGIGEGAAEIIKADGK